MTSRYRPETGRIIPPPIVKGRSPLKAAVALLLVALALRAWDFGNPVIHVDEQYYLLVGDRMLHGALPYLDIWDRKPIGLFAIFAAIRLLPGDGIVASQIVAMLFAAATALMVYRGARRIGAAPLAALAAGACYLIWLPLLSGRAGQSPIFFNLFMTAAALLTLRLPALAAREAREAILANGAAVCLLAGLAIQTKYTPAVEGAFFGLAHLWYLRRAGGRWPMLGLAAVLWIALGLAPTLAAIGIYAARGPAAFQAFWFANFSSILLRSNYAYPAELIGRRLLGISAQLLPFAVCAAFAWRTKPRSEETLLAFAWLGAALIGFAVLGTYFDHYALPLLAPLAIVAAPTFARAPRAMMATLAIGLAIFTIEALARPSDAAGAYAVARVVEANSGGECPYVFTGDSITYQLAHACLPTAYAFPSTLAYAPEQGATGIDEAAEVRRIMAGRPPVVVMGSRPLAAWNAASHAVVAAALARDYRPIFSAPRSDYRMIVYLRRDRPLRR
ncbi:MAG: rane protein [Sphingomonas bacterium]|uniref:ArnT family glycosyltransferase n=1 Tax=Sphingomonas bacterium TaxID=1895847 RepID=UPI0026088DF1|nr:hypothetical protein [Sphingomonas bacterium]MDB5705602.1 rane protein [Sphingomonas bacterium]